MFIFSLINIVDDTNSQWYFRLTIHDIFKEKVIGITRVGQNYHWYVESWFCGIIIKRAVRYTSPFATTWQSTTNKWRSCQQNLIIWLSTRSSCACSMLKSQVLTSTQYLKTSIQVSMENRCNHKLHMYTWNVSTSKMQRTCSGNAK